MNKIQLLAISGSLRNYSSNTNVLQAAKTLAPPSIDINLYLELATLPHFNPDLDREPLPNAVASLRQQIGKANGIIISSPEYAHGVPGSLKNALDWLVSSIEFPNKPVLLINTNPRATIAFNSLQEILITMSARIDRPVTLEIAGRNLDVEDIVKDLKLASSIENAVSRFATNILGTNDSTLG